MRRGRVVVTLTLLLVVGIAASACDSSESTGEAGDGNRSAFLAAVASNTAVAKVDYGAISNNYLVSAGEAICERQASVDRTLDDLELEQAEEEIASRFDFAQAVPKAGAEQDPGVALRNADLRLASAVGRAALEHLCPEQPFNPAR